MCSRKSLAAERPGEVRCVMAEQLPTISVVTPSFNQGRFIERTIRSVLNQQYPMLDYWIIDGGSTDDTLDIAGRYNDRLQLVSEKDRGQANAVNKGFRASSGEIIGWLNSDDIYYPGTLATVAARFEAEPEIDLIYGAANHIDVDDDVVERYPTEPWNLVRFFEACFLCQPAVFFRRSVLDRWGYLDEGLHFCMDYEYWLRLAVGGARFCYEQTTLAGSRMYPENKTLGNRARSHVEINNVVRGKLGRTTPAWILAYAHTVADESYKIPRSCRKRHSSVVALTALCSSVRWNRGISVDVLKYVGTTIAGLVR
jgi:glycosyltransferase involved in cell wall biosynthesis